MSAETERARGATSPLLSAIAAADPATPEALFTFDRIAAAPDPAPDFCETSARIAGSSLAAHRLTYYFDVAKRGAGVARAAADRFAALCEELGVALPPDLTSFARGDVPGRPEILQVVLGVDASREGSSAVAKYYLIFRDAPSAVVRGALAAMGAPDLPASIDPDKAYILGADFGAHGLDDAKLYFRLDRDRLGRAVKNLGDLRILLEGTRYVVLQQCLRRPDRRQMYFHAQSGEVIAAHLARRAREGHRAAADLLARQAAINAARPALELKPWILSFGYRDGRADLGEGNVYFHLAG